MNAARKAGGITVLKQRLTANTLKGHDSNTVQALLRTIIKEFLPQQIRDGQPYGGLILALVRVAIDTFNMSTLAAASSYSGYPYNHSSHPSYNAPAEQMIRIVKFCFEVGAKSQCQCLLLRFVPPPSGSTVAQHVPKVLAPFLPVLQQFLAAERLTFEMEPYKMFAAAVVKSFAETVMSQKPQEVISVARLLGIGCQGCSECRELKAFSLSDKPTISFARVQSIRTHLERQLGSTRSWGVKWDTIRSGSLHTLRVTEPASMTAAGLWAANSRTGKALLQGLGDVGAQARILGAAYPVVYARIYGENAAPLPAGPMPLANANQILNAQKRLAWDCRPSRGLGIEIKGRANCAS